MAGQKSALQMHSAWKQFACHTIQKVVFSFHEFLEAEPDFCEICHLLKEAIAERTL
jgi:hypothetical protein